MTEDTETVPDACPPLSEWRTLHALRAQLEAELFNLNKGVLLDALVSAGVTHVVVTFDGYGDSGPIENVEVRSGDDAIPMPESTIEIAEALWGQSEPKRSIVAIATAIESLAYDEKMTGYHVGGISPFGHRRPVRAALDESALEQPLIVVNGGKRGFLIGLSPQDALEVLDAVVAPLCAET